jgi:flagellar biosynthesis/type III secretory pathway protein FliH
MENQALGEQAKHALQLLIAQEVLEAIKCGAQQALNEAVNSGWSEARSRADKVSRSDLIDEAVKRILRDNALKPLDLAAKIEGWQQRVAQEAIAQARGDAVWTVVNQMLKEEKPALVLLCQEVITKEANKVLVEQISYWKGQFEDVQRRLSNLESSRLTDALAR